MILSKDTYQIQYNDTKIKIQQMLSALNEIARELDRSAKVSLSKINWVSRTNAEQFQKPEFDADKPIFETVAPPEFTKDVHVSNEILRIVPLNDKTVQVTITDASIPPSKCEEIAIDFAGRLYEKATGTKILREQMMLKNIATLSENICEYCLQPIEGLPHACKVCGRTFCYDHRRPETHGCQLKVRVDQPQQPVKHQQQAKHPEQMAQPKVVVQKIPCG
jgi:hypothetical protein